MNEEKTLADLQVVFRRVLADPDLVISEATTARDVRKWDSLNHMHLIAEVERQFAVQFSFDEVRGLANVGDLVQLIHVKRVI